MMRILEDGRLFEDGFVCFLGGWAWNVARLKYSRAGFGTIGKT
jgi:1,4-dihydroxy-2-naphthoate octaprenyltransferase